MFSPLDSAGTLSARARQGLNASPIGLARVVALAIGISLSIATPLDAQANNLAIKQFWMYWHYVSHRYSTTQYDEPNYCAALHHLRTKGWQ